RQDGQNGEQGRREDHRATSPRQPQARERQRQKQERQAVVAIDLRQINEELASVDHNRQRQREPETAPSCRQQKDESGGQDSEHQARNAVTDLVVGKQRDRVPQNGIPDDGRFRQALNLRSRDGKKSRRIDVQQIQ